MLSQSLRKGPPRGGRDVVLWHRLHSRLEISAMVIVTIGQCRRSLRDLVARVCVELVTLEFDNVIAE
ncbi:MAG: hypothetical protein R3E01_00375 [Pirellulaceae bacterium]|nr:hypothetical protein [Planctomycetales bacterium]